MPGTHPKASAKNPILYKKVRAAGGSIKGYRVKNTRPSGATGTFYAGRRRRRGGNCGCSGRGRRRKRRRRR